MIQSQSRKFVGPQAARTFALVSGSLAFAGALLAQSAPAPSASSSASDQAQQLPSFTVNEDQDSGYNAGNSISGTGFNEKNLDLPFTITAITKQFMTDIGAIDLIDAAVMVPGVQNGTQSYNRGNDGLMIRGFLQYPEHDGMYEGVEGNVVVDPIDIERVEVAKGPSSLLYGIVAPGGTVNYITKQAQPNSFGSVDVEGGSESFFRGTVDLNQPIIPGVLLFRFNGAWENGYEREIVGNARSTTLIPTLTWNITKHLSFRVNYEYYMRHENPPQWQLPFGSIGTPASIANSFNKALGYPAPADAVGGHIGLSQSPYGSVDVDQGFLDSSSADWNALYVYPRNFNSTSDNDWLTNTNSILQTELDFKNLGEHWNARVNFDYNRNEYWFEQTNAATVWVAPSNSLAYSNGTWSVAPAYAALTAAQQLTYNANFLTQFFQHPGNAEEIMQNGTPGPLVSGRSQRVFGVTGDNYTMQAEAVGSYTTPIGTIRPLIGAYYNRDLLYTLDWQTSGTAAVPNYQNWDVNPLSPTFNTNRANAPTAAALTNNKPLITDNLALDFTRSVYGVLNCSFFDNKLQIVGGFRFNASGTGSTNFLGTTTAATYAQGLMTSLPTSQVGIGYKIRPDVMLYASFSESYFLPTNAYLSGVGYNAAGTPIQIVTGSAAPTTGQGVEAGIKTDLLNGRISQTFSIYQITESDVENLATAEVTGPSGASAGISVWFQGTVNRSDGLEYELTYSPTNSFQIVFNATDDLVRSIAEPTGYAYYLGLPTSPDSRYTTNLWARYNVTKGFYVAGGYKFQSRYLGSTASAWLVYPKMTEFDAAAGYTWAGPVHTKLTLHVNAMNLANSEYIPDLQSVNYPRRFIAGLTVDY